MDTIKWNRIKTLTIASALAMIALIALQSKWLLHSKNLIEEQFNQKVSMALSMAVAELGHGDIICTVPTPTPQCLPEFAILPPATSQIEEQSLRKVLDRILPFFDMPLDYEVAIHDQASACGVNSPSCCSMDMVAGFEDNFLNISFPNRTQYVLKEMGLMIGASIVILLFISTLFWLTIYYLIQQRTIGERNKDFFNNMAHEFKTPLTNMQLAIRLLNKKEQHLADNKYLTIVDKEIHKLSHQVERVLEVSNLENGAYQLRLEALNLSRLLQEVLEEMNIQIQEQQAHIQLTIPPNLSIMGDAFHLKNAFRNLIDNALKYSQEAPEIYISYQQKEAGIVLLFQDNGIGISKANQQIIFDKFQRIGTGDLHNQKGFGLGLAYVKKVIDLHQGFIKIVSDLGKGSRFDLFLPHQ